MTAEYIFEVLRSHHKAIKDLKPNKNNLNNDVYDNRIVLSSDQNESKLSKNKVG